MKPEKQCERCEHNFKFMHCCIMRDMSEASKKICDGFTKIIPKVEEVVEIAKEKISKQIDYATDERFANSFGKFLLKGGAYSLRTNSAPFKGE